MDARKCLLAAGALFWSTAACVSTDQPASRASPSPAVMSAVGSRSFADPAFAGMCAEAVVDIAEDEPAAPTTEKAIELFATENSILERNTIGFQIKFKGEVVGRLSVRTAPAGGYYVSWARWCYPDPDGS